jgi:hypothetical protein
VLKLKFGKFYLRAVFCKNRPSDLADLADFLNIDSHNAYKNFVEELFSEIVFFRFPRNFEILVFSLF